MKDKVLIFSFVFCNSIGALDMVELILTKTNNEQNIFDKKSVDLIVADIEKEIAHINTQIKALESKIAKCKQPKVKKDLEQDLQHARAEHAKAQDNKIAIRKNCNNAEIKRELQAVLDEINRLNNRYDSVKKKIKSAGAGADQAAQLNSHELNSILSKLAGQKAKVMHLLDLE
jgi:predicted  nucleic acid-binding Zn-ribbon protein